MWGVPAVAARAYPGSARTFPRGWRSSPRGHPKVLEGNSARPREVQLPGLREGRFLGDLRRFDGCLPKVCTTDASSSPNVLSGDDQAIT
jgi:hypothetical protein